MKFDNEKIKKWYLYTDGYGYVTRILTEEKLNKMGGKRAALNNLSGLTTDADSIYADGMFQEFTGTQMEMRKEALCIDSIARANNGRG